MKKKIFVICVDRDNDLGKKTKINGPVIGKEKNLEAAQKLMLADPSESDANTMYAAITKLEEASKIYKNVEIVTITGEGKIGLQADREINKQLDKLQKDYIIDGWILVTDGAEDNQVMPLLQSRAKIISTQRIIIKQAEAVESTFYTIKEALKDPAISRLALGIPGLILLIYVSYDAIHLNILGMSAYQLIALIAGAYLLLKGFGIEDKIVEAFRVMSDSLAEQKISFVLYVAAMLLPIVGIWLAYTQLMSSEFIDAAVDTASALRAAYPLFALAAILAITGRAIDAFYAKKTYNLGNYIVQAISIFCLWAIIDAGTLVFLRQAELTWLPANIMISFVILIIAMRLRKLFDIRERITKLLVGLNAMDETGNYLGKVIEANKTKGTITIQQNKNSKKIEKKLKEFKLIQGRIITTA
jgi:putative membrane protein